MCQSEQINEIATALNATQKQIMCAVKDAKNPFFKSKYATLNAVWEAVKDAVIAQGLAVLQPISMVDGQAVVKTTIMHKSGQYITSECPIVCAKQNDPQALGSAITYARRYSLASMLGVVTDEDDDAEKAMSRTVARPAPTKPKQTPEEQYRNLLEVKGLYSQELLSKFARLSLEDKRKAYERVKGL